ncbi:unnamed protein product [Calicophoron daubneyi]|uniref:tetrahydrofolate synthase n=1 Tax=Calicophoron daubneyi TaxID=300641 RepID=A0AAV2TZ77_CALDB
MYLFKARWSVTHLFMRRFSRRTYGDAIAELNSAIRNITFSKVVDHERMKREKYGVVLSYLEALGISDLELSNLHPVHVTGSKGKGSTCAAVEAGLRNLGFRTGLLSSPHLISVEERIRIDGKPIDRDRFSEVFWDIHDKIAKHVRTLALPPPSFLHYIVLMACHIFVSEKVGAAIFEVGIGGRFDHTNFLKQPAVTVVTNIALEHTDLLGPKLTDIAWRKAGIFKKACPALIPEDLPADVMQVFVNEAKQVECPLYMVPRLEDISLANGGLIIEDAEFAPLFRACSSDAMPLGVINLPCSLAVMELWLQSFGKVKQSHEIGLQPPLRLQVSRAQVQSAVTARWPGRWQKVSRGKITFFIDGAHTLESLQKTAEWFQYETSKEDSRPSARVLLFSLLGSRNPDTMLRLLRTVISPVFDLVVFVDPHDKQFVVFPGKRSLDAECLETWEALKTETALIDEYGTTAYRVQDLSAFLCWLEQLRRFSRTTLSSYGEVIDKENVQLLVPSPQTVAGACSVPVWDKQYASCHVLVTGSLYLVGATLKALNEPV